MASSGTYAFNLTNGGAIIGAFERRQIFTPSLRNEHFVTAARELNEMTHMNSEVVRVVSIAADAFTDAAGSMK